MIKNLVTGLTVVYKAVDYVKITIESFRKFYPDMTLIVVNGSPNDDPATIFCDDLEDNDSNVSVIHLNRNFSHGLSLNIGMTYIESPFVYIFDSDVEMLESGMIENMLKLIDPKTYGVGFINYVDRGGRGTKTEQHGDTKLPGEVRYLHPFACLVQKRLYYEFPDFNFYGAPFIEAMNAVEDSIEDIKVKYFPVKSFVRHYSGGTRASHGDWPGSNPSPELDAIETELRELAHRYIS